MAFLFEKLKVYEQSLRFSEEIAHRTSKPASGNGSIAD
jgi:hypothetical protein